MYVYNTLKYDSDLQDAINGSKRRSYLQQQATTTTICQSFANWIRTLEQQQQQQQQQKQQQQQLPPSLSLQNKNKNKENVQK